MPKSIRKAILNDETQIEIINNPTVKIVFIPEMSEFLAYYINQSGKYTLVGKFSNLSLNDVEFLKVWIRATIKNQKEIKKNYHLTNSE